MLSKPIVLYDDKRLCSGCGACMNACPTGSISMQPDQYGFLYPFIDQHSCIGCGLCQRACGYQELKLYEKSQNTWAAAAKESRILTNSASGGVFTSIAEYFLHNHGIVYGCALCQDGNTLTPQHIRVDRIENLGLLQGSKYVQSDVNFQYKNVQQDLNAGKYVLFSGTPCQIGGLKAFLRHEYTNLCTVDIICHGVPSKAFFQDFLALQTEKLGGKVIDFKFRDKTMGWGQRGVITYQKKNGKICHRQLPVKVSSYHKLFLDSEIYRDSCYSCRYAQERRVGDITLGDYWGIEIEHPEVLNSDSPFSYDRGISCVFANTEKGREIILQCADRLTLMDSSLDRATRHNAQLKAPSPMGKNRKTILQLYCEGGYKAVHAWYNKSQGVKIIKSKLICRLPLKMQVFLHKVIHR